ncbi:uncharacterized protein [Nicotiana tomentosiformis]|uniref:uncharacterized protein n=1 Tax=Nicotiana tomentosiformis TaxID=4098 RepID=UPI00388C3754
MADNDVNITYNVEAQGISLSMKIPSAIPATRGMRPRQFMVDSIHDMFERQLLMVLKTSTSLKQISGYNFNVSVVELVSAIKNIKEARFLKIMRSNPSQKDPNLWCEYHGTNGHHTGDCRHLHEEVATLLKNGHLREFLSDRAKNNYGRNRDNAEPLKEGENPPCLIINMIFGGNKINGVTFSIVKKTKVSVTHSKRLREVAEDDITFMEEEAYGLLLPHNDALVISLDVLDLKIKRVLVDPGSSANIIQWRVLEQAKLTGSIILTTKLLAGFNLASVTT